MDESVINIENLVKYFDGRCVLDGINLKVPQGCVYGLLGRNGAGKTTIIRILLGLDFPSRGQTFLLGKKSSKLSAKIRGRIGCVAEGHNLIQNYKVNRLIKLCKALSVRWDDKFFEHLIETFRLPMDRRVRELSMGMRAQLNLALALATEPELLILDDPTLGLDTVSRRQFLELAVEIIQKQGRTILFCSHILSDVERIAERIGILTIGKYLLENLHPPILSVLSYFTANSFEAGSGYRALFILPNSFIAMKGRDVEGNFAERLMTALLLILPSIILAIFLIWRINRDARIVGLSNNTRLFWIIGTISFGLVAYITYRLTRPKITLVTCKNCGKPRRPDMDRCHRCNSKWDVPELIPPAWRVVD